VAGGFEYGDEPLGSVKCGTFLDYLLACASQEGLCCVELVSLSVCLSVRFNRSSRHIFIKNQTAYFS
jgi:hypothetical protein